MLANRKLLLPGTGLAVLAALAVVIGVVAASGGGSDENGGRESVSADRDAGGGSGAGMAMCAEDVPDCDDMIVDPDGDASDGPAAVNPDEPVTSGPITSIDDINPGECNMVHNIEVCRKQATEASVMALAAKLGVEPEDIAVEGSEIAEWPDACLGVPQPDTACAQVITTGWLIMLDHAGTAYEYHTNADGSQALLAE